MELSLVGNQPSRILDLTFGGFFFFFVKSEVLQSLYSKNTRNVDENNQILTWSYTRFYLMLYLKC